MGFSFQSPCGVAVERRAHARVPATPTAPHERHLDTRLSCCAADGGGKPGVPPPAGARHFPGRVRPPVVLGALPASGYCIIGFDNLRACYLLTINLSPLPRACTQQAGHAAVWRAGLQGLPGGQQGQGSGEWRPSTPCHPVAVDLWPSEVVKKRPGGRRVQGFLLDFQMQLLKPPPSSSACHRFTVRWAWWTPPPPSTTTSLSP